MTKKCFCILLGVIVALSLFTAVNPMSASAASGASYYVSSSEGDDGNPGTESEPWQTLSKISENTFNAGDTVCLKSGDIFEGAVTLNGAGTEADPVTLAAYGGGDRPYIKGKQDNIGSSVTIPPESQGWRIIGIGIGNSFTGIFIGIDDSAGNDYYYIEDCYIHDSNNVSAMLPFGHAIKIKGTVQGINTASNITVKNCIFKNNDRDFFPDNLEFGIHLANVLIDGCTFTGGGYNSIYHTEATKFDIKNSLWLDNGLGEIGVGNTCIISGELTGGPDTNIVSGNEFGYMRDPGGADGCAYDFENNTDGISFINNFVHNCYGQAIMIMPHATNCRDIRIENNIFYRNLSETNRHKGELALYGGGTGTVAGNIFELRFRGLFNPLKMTDGAAAGLDMSNNVKKNITGNLLKTPVCVIDNIAKTAKLTSSEGADIYYTTDGSVPTKSGMLYQNEEISVSKTTVINCKAFAEGRFPSITGSFLIAPGGEASGLNPSPDKLSGFEIFLLWLNELSEYIRSFFCGLFAN
ncbi:MAG: chitobiase/beta-hexosaminidase C-terminal domain-containing protein [Oscillospiraceae bacterium]|nr:chitobiase/beta-hexosaminidase C-terminal domain-containing protein [Oscillospiraceae bacterium]